MNKQNLIRNEDLTPSERRESARKAGMASAETRRRRKQLRELAEIIGQAPLTEEEREHLLELGVPEKELCKDFLIVVALFEKAAKGDVAAFNAIRDIKGEKPTENMAASLPNVVEVRIIQAQRNEFASSEDEIVE